MVCKQVLLQTNANTTAKELNKYGDFFKRSRCLYEKTIDEYSFRKSRQNACIKMLAPKCLNQHACAQKCLRQSAPKSSKCLFQCLPKCILVQACGQALWRKHFGKHFDASIFGASILLKVFWCTHWGNILAQAF